MMAAFGKKISNNQLARTKMPANQKRIFESLSVEKWTPRKDPRNVENKSRNNR
jgi:hypothetical protein